MTNRELIKQLLDEDLDAEVVIEATNSKFNRRKAQLQGITDGYFDKIEVIVLVPEGRLVVE